MAPADNASGRGAKTKETKEGRAITRPDQLSKVMAMFRIPKEIHAELTSEARSTTSDLTGYVNRLFDSFLHYFTLPSVVVELLERDRAELGFRRFEYYQYVLFRRYEALAKHGPAFDKGQKGK